LQTANQGLADQTLVAGDIYPAVLIHELPQDLCPRPPA
jgi:hypothetical protein